MTVTDAILVAVRAAVPGTRIYDATRPDGSAGDTPLRYAVVTVGWDSEQSEALALSYDTAEPTVRVLSVGPDRSSAEAISRAIRAALLGQSFTAAPWTATVLEHHGQHPRRDPDIPGRVVVFCTDQYDALAHRT